MTNLFSEIAFLIQRLDWQSVLDIILVTVIFFVILISLRATQATVLMRGVVFLIIVIILITNLFNLPAFSWLVDTTLPVLLLAIPVIFAPEIRQALERIGRAGTEQVFWRVGGTVGYLDKETIQSIVKASARLAARKHGALIVLQRNISLNEYVRSGVQMYSSVTPEVLLQIFYPNTPLHDGAVIISNNRLAAASCVMPLSSSGVLNRSPERQMGLRHRAALGTSEASDALAIVVSEETGSISIAHGGRMIRRLDSERLENILLAFFRPSQEETGIFNLINQVKEFFANKRRSED